MSDNTNQPDAQDVAREAILKAIPEAIDKLQRQGGPAQAEGLRHLAEAYAWIVVPNNSH